LASGALEGDVSAPRVVIAEGAFFKGKVEMTGSSKADDKPARVDEKK
jgi:cytoskeletal protein CcmA (bactofilin family)